MGVGADSSDAGVGQLVPQATSTHTWEPSGCHLINVNSSVAGRGLFSITNDTFIPLTALII